MHADTLCLPSSPSAAAASIHGYPLIYFASVTHTCAIPPLISLRWTLALDFPIGVENKEGTSRLHDK